MTTEQISTDTVLEAFLQALQGRKFTECYALLATVRATLGEQSAALALYFAGLLANEAERDAAKAERLLTTLLEQTIDPALRARTLRALGVAYEYQNQSNKSIATFQQLVMLYETLEKPLEQAKSLKNLAIACENGYARGDLDYAQLYIPFEQSTTDQKHHLTLATTVLLVLSLQQLNVGKFDSGFPLLE